MVCAVSIWCCLEGSDVSRIGVIGGGLAGASTALLLARAGKDVTLFEKTKGAHHKVCGEFISHEGQMVLRHFGVMEELIDGVWIENFRLSMDEKTATVQLPFRGYSLSRYRLDETLLKTCEKSDVTIWRGQVVKSLEKHGEKWRLATTDAIEDFDNVVLATGKHDLRGHGRSGGLQRDYIGFKLNLRLRAEAAEQLRGHGDILFFDGGYAGLELIEEGIATLALIVNKRVFNVNDGSFEHLYSRLCFENQWAAWMFRESTWIWQRALSIANIPYGYVYFGRGQTGLYRVGDQFAVIPSFSGDGMSIALTSGLQCADALCHGVGQRQYHHSLYKAHANQVRLAVWIQEMAARRWTQALTLKMVARQPWLIRQLARWTRSPLPSGGL